MSRNQFLTRRTLTPAAKMAAAAAGGAVIAALGLTMAFAAAGARAHDDSFTFRLVPSAGIKACLPHAGGSATITKGSVNETMTVKVHGMPANAGFDLFVIQLPTKPFGVSWYQTDVRANGSGSGSATVRGVFSKETFSVSPGGTTTFAPTHQFHLGLWFNNPRTPFRLGCEPGATAPIVTPFNGEQHAGIQVLNTSQFPAHAGPLSHVR
jgi:hypothetical protein